MIMEYDKLEIPEEILKMSPSERKKEEERILAEINSKPRIVRQDKITPKGFKELKFCI